MIDTHTHLYFPDYKDESPDVIERGLASGVSHFILPNVNEESLLEVKKLHAKYPDATYMAIGLHPTDINDDNEEFLEEIDLELSKGGFVAIGETGIDLHWETNNLNQQKVVFRKQLELAEKYRLPVIIHSRDAREETLEVLREVKLTVPLVFHSFTGTPEDVKRIREEFDPWFGINGVVTYKNAPELREALKEIGLDRIVLETDAPFLTPVPHRGERNESAYLVHVRDKIAEVLEKDPKEIETITDVNARKIFGI